MSITKNDVISSYKLLLEREPESEKVIQEKLQCNTITDLVTEIINSDEFISIHDNCAQIIDRYVYADTEYDFKIYGNLKDKAIFTNILLNKYEIPTVSFIKKYLKCGQTFIDLGANIGFFSLLARTIVGKEGKVFGFEPMPELYEAYNNGIKANGFNNCKTYNIALSDFSGYSDIIFAPDSTNWGGAYLSMNNNIPKDHKVIKVKTDILSKYIKGETIDFIKIDTEGAEYVILNSIIDELVKYRPIILSEVHKEQLKKVSMCDAKDYILLLTNIGYSCNELLCDGKLGRTINGNENFDCINVVFHYKLNW